MSLSCIHSQTLTHVQVFHTPWHGAESGHTGFRADTLSLHLKANSQEPWGPHEDIRSTGAKNACAAQLLENYHRRVDVKHPRAAGHMDIF